MEDPYRVDVINTRLDGLEKNIVRSHVWRATCFAFIVLFLGASLLTTAVIVRARDSATCRGEVLVDHGTPTLRCGHKNHKMTIIDRDAGHVVVSCTCEP